MQRKGNAYMVPEGRVLDRVLSSQGNAAEQDEEEDQVGEDSVVDNAVALEAKPAWGGGEKKRRMSGRQGSSNLGLRIPGPPSSAQRVPASLGGVFFSPKASRCWVRTAMTLPAPRGMSTQNVATPKPFH